MQLANSSLRLIFALIERECSITTFSVGAVRVRALGDSYIGPVGNASDRLQAASLSQPLESEGSGAILRQLRQCYSFEKTPGCHPATSKC